MSGSDSSSDELEGETYEVEKILNKKNIVNDEMEEVTLYQIKWKDYDDSHISWEPIECLTGCEAKLQQFNEDWEKRKAAGEFDFPPKSTPRAHKPASVNGDMNGNASLMSVVDENADANNKKGGHTAALKSRARIDFEGISSNDDDDGYEPNIEYDAKKKNPPKKKPQKAGPKSKTAAATSKPTPATRKRPASNASSSSLVKSTKSVIQIETGDESDDSNSPFVTTKPKPGSKSSPASKKADSTSKKAGPQSKKAGPLSSKAGPASSKSKPATTKAVPAKVSPPKALPKLPEEAVAKPKPKLGPKSRMEQLAATNNRASSPAASTDSKSSKRSSSPAQKPLTNKNAAKSKSVAAAAAGGDTNNKSGPKSKAKAKKVGPKSRTSDTREPPSPAHSNDSSLFFDARTSDLQAPSPPSAEPPFELMEMDGKESDSNSSGEAENSIDTVCNHIRTLKELEKKGNTDDLVVEGMGSNIDADGTVMVLVKFGDERREIVDRQVIKEHFAKALCEYYQRIYKFTDVLDL